jgi:hypothetical protein
MASPMPEWVPISIEEHSVLLMTKQSADYVYGIIFEVAYSPNSNKDVKEFALNLLDEWTK